MDILEKNKGNIMEFNNLSRLNQTQFNNRLTGAQFSPPLRRIQFNNRLTGAQFSPPLRRIQFNTRLMGEGKLISWLVKSLIWFLLCMLIFFFSTTISYADERKRILLLETMPVPVVKAHSRWFVEELKLLGYRNEATLELKILEANGDRGLAETLLNSAVQKKRPDLVVTNATLASQTALKLLKGTKIPILFMTVSDPVGAGLICKIGEPTGTNITGRIHMINRQTRINMVMRLLKSKIKQKPVRIGFIYSTYPSAVGDLEKLQIAAGERSDIVFVPYPVEYRKVPEGTAGMLKDVRKGIKSLEEKVDYWWEPSGPLGELPDYSKLLLSSSLKPVVMGTKLKSVEMGALLLLTPSIEGSGREVARLADAILKGREPGKIPAVPPASFDLGLNLGTALKYGIVIPPDLLKLAGEHVYK